MNSAMQASITLGAMMSLCALIACAPGSSRTARTKAPATSRATASASSSGLELVRWYIPAAAAARRDAIARLIELHLATRVESPLSSNGITLLRAKSAQLAEIVHELGTSLAARRTVLGQANSFADLSTIELEAGTTVMTSGRPEKTEGALTRFAVRGWCFPTVEGACARVELLLGETPTRLTSVAIDPSEVRERTREIAGGSMTLELEADEALLLMETPLVFDDADADDGPVVIPPPTRGSLLFSGAPFSDRALVLVIEPTFADMVPQAARTATPPKP